MGEENKVMVFIEFQDQVIEPVSLELVSKAKELAEILDGHVEALAIGYNIKKELKILGQYGCQQVYCLEDERLDNYTTLPYAKAAVEMVKKYKPRILLIGATPLGRDLAPRVASELQCGLTADCTDLQIGDYKFKKRYYPNTLLQIRPAFGGNIVATIVSPECFPSIATVRPGVMKKTRLDKSCSMDIIEENINFNQDDFPTEVLEIFRQEKSVDLGSARVIVSVGMGAADPESLALAKELAEVLGGVVGASRPVIDSGILPRDHQIGQTGATVRPNLYIACGISGQIQHRAGMCQSKRIIAVNNDPTAPIFDIAHYGIVGQIKEVLPKMIKAYRDKA